MVTNMNQNEKEEKMIPYLASYISEEAIQAAISVMRSDFVDKGPIAAQFEKNFLPLVNAKYAISTNSCTAALHVALLVAGVGPGDEVITTPFTYIASNLSVLYTGATPVFCDVLRDTMNIDPADIESKITHKTKAILVVHISGTPCAMDEIQAVARKYNLPVIEDAAQALGATYKDKKVGEISEMTCFSFDPFKPLPSGAGGGMVVTNNPDYEELARKLRYYGFQGRFGGDLYKKYGIKEVGMKYYMKEISAAMANANLKHFYVMLNWRKHVVHRYVKELSDVKGLRLLRCQVERGSACYLFLVFVERRYDFLHALQERGVQADLPVVRNDIAPIFGGKRRELPVMNEIEQSYVGLPVHNRMTEDHITRVIEAVKKGW